MISKNWFWKIDELIILLKATDTIDISFVDSSFIFFDIIFHNLISMWRHVIIWCERCNKKSQFLLNKELIL